MKKRRILAFVVALVMIFGTVNIVKPISEVNAAESFEWMRTAETVLLNKRSPSFSINRQTINDDGITVRLFGKYFYFNLSAPSYLRIKLFVGGGNSGDIYLYNSSGQQIIHISDTNKHWQYNHSTDETFFNAKYLNVLPKGDYYIRFRSINADNTYGYFNLMTTIPTTQHITKIRRGKKAIQLNWNKTPGAEGYLIYRSKTKNGKYTLIKKITTNRSKYTINNVTRGVKYYYKVKAYRRVGSGMSYSDTCIPQWYIYK